MKLETRLRIMSPVSGSPQGTRGSAGIGRRARLRTACRKAWGFESPLPHHSYDQILVSRLPKYAPGQAYPLGFSFAFSLLEDEHVNTGNDDESWANSLVAGHTGSKVLTALTEYAVEVKP